MDTITTLRDLNTLNSAKGYLTSPAHKPFRLQNFIDNEFSANPASGKWIDSFDPRTGELLAQIPRSTPSDVDRAVDAASRAFPSWAQTSRHERSEIVLRIADCLSGDRELFAVWESIDQGKTLARASVEVERAIANFRYFATYILHEEGAVRFVDGQTPSTLAYEHRSPVGVFTLISPWNMPLYLLT